MRIFLAMIAGVAMSCGTGSHKTDGGFTVTWHKDVLPITQRQCVNCHSQGGLAPFSLETYADAQPVAYAMKGAVADRRMPPWMPDVSCGGPFRDERRLTQEEIDTIGAWADTGAHEGNPADAPSTPTVRGQLERVDATAAMRVAYEPNHALSDDYRCFVVDPGLTRSQQLIGYDISPGNRAVVHHVILYIVDQADAQAADVLDATPGWACFGGPNVKTSGAAGAWTPGSPAVIFPPGTGITLPAGKVFAMQVHYNTAGGVGADLTSIKLMYATAPVTGATLLPIVDRDFAIPPNAQSYTHAKSFANPLGLPIKVWGLLPHMHTKGQRITITVDSEPETCLIDIPRWDFHWQQQYFRPTPYTMKGTEAIRISCTWSNPTARTITWGEGTDDEMCFAYVYATL